MQDLLPEQGKGRRQGVTLACRVWTRVTFTCKGGDLAWEPDFFPEHLSEPPPHRRIAPQQLSWTRGEAAGPLVTPSQVASQPSPRVASPEADAVPAPLLHWSIPYGSGQAALNKLICFAISQVAYSGSLKSDFCLVL